MKTVLTAVNSKYIHSSLAIYYIKAYNSSLDINTAEYSVNDNINAVYGDLFLQNADVYAFSCCIWNIEYILKLTKMLKRVKEDCVIILGGPEAGYNTKEIFEKNPEVDYILCGEGEKAFGELIYALENSRKTNNIKGTATRENPFPEVELLPLETVVFPYNEDNIKDLDNKIIYFETSRGCPFGCTYCLSSEDRKIRYFPMEYVKKGFDFFFEKNVPLVKLVDRTFNADNKRALEIIEYIIKNSKNTSVHLEIEPHLLNGELTNALTNAPKGLFELEIGIQTANQNALRAVNRKADFEVISKNINTLRKNNNMHIHLDLIAGLPEESKASFEKSFNYVYSLNPHMLQLGFLKVLHGTKIEKESGIVYSPHPPYEVLKTPYITAGELLSLKETEEAVERFYNSGAFSRTVKYLADIKYGDNPFSFFEKTGIELKQRYGGAGISRNNLYTFLYEVFGEEIKEMLTLDFLENNPNNRLPEFAGRKEPRGFKLLTTEFLNNENNFEKYNLTRDYKKIRIEPFGDKIILADYENGKIIDVTEDFMN